MNKIVVTGGKGGTGKSTVAVLIANKFIDQNKKVVLVDADVECPNDHLLINEKLDKQAKTVYGNYPKLDKRKCRKCGDCVRACRENAIYMPTNQKGEKGYPIFIKELCSGCGACWISCPFKAIKPQKEEIGKIFINHPQKNLYLLTGVAKPGVEETGPIVSQLKDFAVKFAKQREVNTLLIDTAAGTHCPVISALLDSDLAYCVTEPTPMGSYDLELILKLCEKINIPARIILNQADLGNKQRIYTIAKKFDLEIKKEIPYSKEIVNAYSKGRLLKTNFKL